MIPFRLFASSRSICPGAITAGALAAFTGQVPCDRRPKVTPDGRSVQEFFVLPNVDVGIPSRRLTGFGRGVNLRVEWNPRVCGIGPLMADLPVAALPLMTVRPLG